MMDYLSNLSSRSFDFGEDVGLVRPRLPSLFEPWKEPWGGSVEIPSWSPGMDEHQDTGPSPASLASDEDPHRLEVNLERPADIARTTAAASAEVVHQRPALEEDSPGTTQTFPREMRAAATLLPRGAPPPAVSTDALAKASDGELRPAEIRSQPRDASEAEPQALSPEVRPMTTRGAAVGKPTAPGRREAGSAPPLRSSDEQRLVVEKILLKKRVRRIVEPERLSGEDAVDQESVITAQSVVPLRHPVEPIALPSLHPSRREGEPKAEPTIQVTIGRIEVRATTAPLQPRPKPRAPAPMSLDEYLGLRSGGGR
jgi:hypothetical protein